MQWIKSFTWSSSQTKVFVINWAIYMFLIVATSVYAYARLDYVRSGPQHEHTSENQTP